MNKNRKTKLLASVVKRTPVVRTRLSAEDAKRFEQECFIEKKTGTEIAREAICFYLDRKDEAKSTERELLLEKRMRKMEERMAALQARTAIDVGMIYHLIYINMDEKKRDEDIAWAYRSSVERLKKKLEGPAKELKEKMQESIAQNTPKTTGTRSQE